LVAATGPAVAAATALDERDVQDAFADDAANRG